MKCGGSVCVCVCASSSEPRAHLRTVTQQKGVQWSDITTETKSVCGRQVGEKGVKDEDWRGCGLCGSRIIPLQLFSTCHINTLRTQQ